MKKLKFTKSEKVKAMAWLDSYIDSLDDAKTFEIEVKEFRKKRSLTSNSYAWQLLDKLAVVLYKSKEEIYKSFIKEIGDNNTDLLVKTEAVEKLRSEWQSKGIGYVSDIIETYDNGYTAVKLYYGSSTYNQVQMNHLIQLIVQECKQFDIETMTPQEIQHLIEIGR